MTKKTRKLILYCLVLGFFLAAGGFLFYSFGWSLNPTANDFFTFKKTGAVFLKIWPADAQIKINGKSYSPKRDMFGNGGSELIKGLLPGNYQIEILKENFGSWKKSLTVEAGLISGASKIFLFPKKIPTETVSRPEAEKFWLTENKKEEIKKIFNSLKQKQLKMPGEVPVTQIISYPFNTSKSIITTQKAVYILDRQNFSLEILTLNPVKALVISNSEIAFFDWQDNLQIYNLDSRKITEKIPFKLLNETEKIAFSKSNIRIALLDNKGNLFVYNRTQKELKQIIDADKEEGIKDFKFSPDSKKIAALTRDGEIEIIFLEDYHQDFKITAGEKFKLNLSINSKPLDFDWLPKILGHLIINYSDKIIAAEVDSRPPANWWVLGENIESFAFDKENNLYFLKDNQFLKVILNQNY
ncbi:MAG: hypothetical protein Q8N22_02520 [bacterium]|nr:hypothetical protein [bacterium]